MAAPLGRLRIFVFVLLFSLGYAKEWTPSNFPNPMVDVEKCGRGGKQSWICDPDGLMNPSIADHVEGELKKIYGGISPYTTKPCGSAWQGFQVAVAVMGWFHVPAGVDPGAQAELMAKALHDAWGVGNPDCNNGILLLLGVHNRQVYLSTGRGALPYLSNQNAKVIIDRMKPNLRQQKYAEAVDGAVVDIGLALAGNPLKPESDGGGWVFAVFAAAFASILGYSMFNGWKKNQQYKAAKNGLEQIKRDQQAIRENRYVATTCPICLDTFIPDERQAGNNTAEPAAKGEGADANPSAPPLPADESTPLLSPDSGGASSSAAAAAGGSTSFINPLKGAKQPAGKKPLYLRCGHGFCEPCISEWLKTKNACPICRKDIDNDSPPQPERPQPPPNCSQNYYEDLYYPELSYRMQRMHFLYPDYITYGMRDRWEQDLLHRRELNTESMRQFELNDPTTRTETTNFGSSGASSSFGGGGSSGGGGYGSSW